MKGNSEYQVLETEGNHTPEGFLACDYIPDRIHPLSGTFWCIVKQSHVSARLCVKFQKEDFWGCVGCEQGNTISLLLNTYQKKRKKPTLGYGNGYIKMRRKKRGK